MSVSTGARKATTEETRVGEALIQNEQDLIQRMKPVNISVGGLGPASGGQGVSNSATTNWLEDMSAQIEGAISYAQNDLPKDVNDVIHLVRETIDSTFTSFGNLVGAINDDILDILDGGDYDGQILKLRVPDGITDYVFNNRNKAGNDTGNIFMAGVDNLVAQGGEILEFIFDAFTTPPAFGQPVGGIDGVWRLSSGSGSGGGSSIERQIAARCFVATTTAGNLTSDFDAGQTIDSETLSIGDRILIKDQADASENGIYDINAGDPTRATDFDAGAEVFDTVLVPVAEGTVNANTYWQLITNDPVIVDTDNLVFAEFGAGGSGEFFGPWTAIHNAGDLDLINLHSILFNEANNLITADPVGMLFRTDTGDRFDWDIVGTGVVMTINPTALTMSVNLDFDDQDALNINNMTFNGTNSVITALDFLTFLAPSSQLTMSGGDITQVENLIMTSITANIEMNNADITGLDHIVFNGSGSNITNLDDITFVGTASVLDMNDGDIVNADNMTFNGLNSVITALDFLTFLAPTSQLTMSGGDIIGVENLTMTSITANIEMNNADITGLDHIVFNGSGSNLTNLDDITLVDTDSVLDMNDGDIVNADNMTFNGLNSVITAIDFITMLSATSQLTMSGGDIAQVENLIMLGTSSIIEMSSGSIEGLDADGGLEFIGTVPTLGAIQMPNGVSIRWMNDGGTNDIGILVNSSDDLQLIWSSVVQYSFDAEHLDINGNYIQFDGIADPGTVTGEPTLFADASNSDHLTVKSGDGTLYDLETTGGGGGATIELDNLGTTAINAQLNLNSGINIIPVDFGSALGDATHTFGTSYFTRINFDEAGRNIRGSGSIDMIVEVPSGGNMFFRENGTNFWELDGDSNQCVFYRDIALTSGEAIRSHQGTEIGFFVTNSTATVGGQGTIQIPTSTATAIGNNANLNTNFGNVIGAIGIYNINGTVPVLAIKIATSEWVLIALPDGGGSVTSDHVT